MIHQSKFQPLRVPWFVSALAFAAAILFPPNAQAAVTQLEATLDQAQVVPFPSSVPGASGFGSMSFDTDTNLFSWNISFSGLSGDAIAAHFHGPAPVGVNAGVQVTFGGLSGPTGQWIGNTTLTFFPADLLAGLWYINIHTVLNPAGEIRGQVLRASEPSPSDPEPIPAPGALALVLTGVASLAGLRRRRQSTITS